MWNFTYCGENFIFLKMKKNIGPERRWDYIGYLK